MGPRGWHGLRAKYTCAIAVLVVLLWPLASAAHEPLACPWCTELGQMHPEQLKIFLAPLPERWMIRAAGNLHYQGVSQEHPFGLPVPAAAGGRAPRTYPTASSQLWDTYMFSAGQWWLRQTRLSPLRVDAAEAADVVLVPLATLNLMSWEVGGLEAVSEWYAQAPGLLPHLGTKPHIVVLSKGEYDFVTPAHHHVNGSAAEPQTTAYGLVGHPGAANFTFLTHGLAPKVRGGAASYIIGNVINVPFPCWVHFGRGSPEYAYHTAAAPASAASMTALVAPLMSLVESVSAGIGDSREAAAAKADTGGPRDDGPAAGSDAPGLLGTGIGPEFDGAEVTASKRLLVSMAFATRKPFRHLLRAQCWQRRGSCRLHEVKTEQVAQDRSGRVQNTSLHFAELAAIAQLTRDAWFCAMPPGDQPLRKAMFDCLLLGAIPVLFEPFALDTFTFSDLADPRQFVVDLSPAIAAGRLAMNATGAAAAPQNGAGPAVTNFVDYLEREFPAQRRLEMLAAFHARQRMYQYSLDPVHELVTFGRASLVHPADDAFTLSWKAAVRSLCGRGQLPGARCAGGGGQEAGTAAAGQGHQRPAGGRLVPPSR